MVDAPNHGEGLSSHSQRSGTHDPQRAPKGRGTVGEVFQGFRWRALAGVTAVSPLITHRSPKLKREPLSDVGTARFFQGESAEVVAVR
jgi:hypothetical protein